ncbi:hypothetical protein NPIL_528681 [Nephila pilipes]|uniref:Uncharacterized protein n=1 Tax=Nephila pilipes TaxID=299642 RepID=A0A8X6MNU5_NEPPI|nr:hypothetical protein NPIL_528681 [Nephila pilipes]
MMHNCVQEERYYYEIQVLRPSYLLHNINTGNKLQKPILLAVDFKIRPGLMILMATRLLQTELKFSGCYQKMEASQYVNRWYNLLSIVFHGTSQSDVF